MHNRINRSAQCSVFLGLIDVVQKNEFKKQQFHMILKYLQFKSFHAFQNFWEFLFIFAEQKFLPSFLSVVIFENLRMRKMSSFVRFFPLISRFL